VSGTLVDGDARLHTLRGTMPVWKAACEGRPLWGFTWDGDRIWPCRLEVSADPIEDIELLRVVLDNGDTLRVPRDTLFITRHGHRCEASALTVGQSVMPLYLKNGPGDYPMYRQVNDDVRRLAPAPCDRKPWRLIARMVAEWRRNSPVLPGAYVRHINGDRSDCVPSNLRLDTGRKARRQRRLRAHCAAQKIKVPGNHKITKLDGVDRVTESFTITPLENAFCFAVSEVFVEVRR
jgi:hypothetical protein